MQKARACRQAGFVPIIILIGILVLASVGGAYYFFKVKTPVQKACTMDAKICLDGSSVGRSGPNCEFSPCPPEPSPTPRIPPSSSATPIINSNELEFNVAKELKDIDDKNGWKTYRLEAVKLEFKLPEAFIHQYQLRIVTIPGQVGSQTIIETLGMDDIFTMAITSVDYQQGREGSFMDLQGFKIENGKYYAKFVMNQTFEISKDAVNEVKNPNGINILKVRGKSRYSEEWGNRPIAGTPGEGYLGALINVNNPNYSGVVIQMKLDKDLTEQVFDQILSTFKFTN